MNYVDMMNHILPYVAGCPEELVVQKLRDSAIEFCKETHCHITSMVIRFESGYVDLGNMVSQIVDIADAKIDGKSIPVFALNDPALLNLEDDEYALRFADPNTPFLRPAASASSPVTVEILAVIAPGPESTKVLDDFWRQHHKALIDGALSLIYEIPSRAWSNPQLSGYHKGNFESAKAKAKAAAHRNHFKPARRLRVRPA